MNCEEFVTAELLYNILFAYDAQSNFSEVVNFEVFMHKYKHQTKFTNKIKSIFMT